MIGNPRPWTAFTGSGQGTALSEITFLFSIHPVSKTVFIYLAVLVGLFTYTLYRYHDSQPPDQQQVERCNELVSQMPERNAEEINRSINTFLECLAD